MRERYRTSRVFRKDEESFRGILGNMMRMSEELPDEERRSLAEVERLNLDARLEDMHIWDMVINRAGGKRYTYYMASWREDWIVRNVYLGSARKMSKDEALLKAREIKKSLDGQIFQEARG